MSTIAEQIETQLRNIEARTGRSRQELYAFVHEGGDLKHGQLVTRCKEQLGLGHGDANTLVHCARQSHGDTINASKQAAGQDPADGWYSGKKAALRPIHDAVLRAVAALGPEVEHAPKKTYLSLRRAKQFATVGPATASLVELGFNLKGAPAEGRVEALPPGGMCTHRARIASVQELDEELVGWLRRAFEAAG